MTVNIRDTWRRWRYHGDRRKTDEWRTDLIVIVAAAVLVGGLVAALTLLLTR